MSFRTTS